MARCPSVFLSFTWSVETAERIELGFGVGASFDLSYTVLKGNLLPPKIRELSFVPNSGLRKFCHDCQQSSSTVELVDHTYDGRRVIAGRTLFNTRRSTVTLELLYIHLLWIRCTTYCYSRAGVDKISTDTARRAVRLWQLLSFLFESY